MSETVTEAPAATPVEAPASPSEATEAGDDLRSVIQAAYKEHTSVEPVRGPDGKFAKAEVAPEAPAAEAAPDQETDQPSAPAPASERPDAWSEAAWNALSPEAREAVTIRERDMHKALVERAEHSQEVESYRKAYAPHAERFAQLGVSPPEAFSRLLDWERAVRQNPAAALSEMAKAVGFDLRSLVSSSDQSPPPMEFRDPRLDRILQEQESAKAAAERQASAQITAQIEAFAADSANVHFPTVRATMGHLMQANPDWSLREAYDAAVFAHPKLRADRIEAEAAKRIADAQKAADARAKAARAASVSVRDGPASGVNGHAIHADDNGTWGDAIRAAFRSQA